MSSSAVPKLSWKDKFNWELLNRLIHWRANNFQVSEMQSELTKRNVAFKKSTLKPELAELLRETIENEMSHQPAYLCLIRKKMIKAFEYGANKDGYNKKAMVQRLQSRGLKVPRTKGECIARLKEVYQAEADEFQAKARAALRKNEPTKPAPSASAPTPTGKENAALRAITPSTADKKPAAAAAAAAPAAAAGAGRTTSNKEKMNKLEVRFYLAVPPHEVQEAQRRVACADGAQNGGGGGVGAVQFCDARQLWYLTPGVGKNVWKGPSLELVRQWLPGPPPTVEEASAMSQLGSPVAAVAPVGNVDAASNITPSPPTPGTMASGNAGITTPSSGEAFSGDGTSISPPVAVVMEGKSTGQGKADTTSPPQFLGNVFIRCPFQQKDEAKKHGAKWHAESKTWYVPHGVPLRKFRPWIAEVVIDEDWPIDVPFDRKDEVKANGARWNTETKKWYIPRGVHVTPFVEWMKGERAPYDVYLNVPFRDRAEVKAAGGRWDTEKKLWYIPQGLLTEPFFKKWEKASWQDYKFGKEQNQRYQSYYGGGGGGYGYGQYRGYRRY